MHKLQQKGLEDYKLATAHASLNADFGMEDRVTEVKQALGALALDGGDADAAVAQPAQPTDAQAKPAAAAAAKKEVRTFTCLK